jgi:hypothetical protein
VHDGGSQLTEQLVQLGVLPDAVAWWLAQRDELNITALDALAKICDFGQRQHGVSVRVCGHVVDEVDNAVLQPTRVKAEHNMEYERTLVTWHKQHL